MAACVARGRFSPPQRFRSILVMLLLLSAPPTVLYPAALAAVPLPDLVVPPGGEATFAGIELEVAGDITVGAGATLRLDKVTLRMTAPQSRITLEPWSKVVLLNGTRLTAASPGAYTLRLETGALLTADHAVLERAAGVTVANASVEVNLTRVADLTGPVALLGDARLLAVNSSFANTSSPTLDLADDSAAEVRGIGAPSYALAPAARFSFVTFATVEVRDASDKVLAGAEWAVTTDGIQLAASPGFGGPAPRTEVNHRGYASPQWVAVPQFVDAGGNRSYPLSEAFARYASWSETRPIDTSTVSTVLFSAAPAGVRFEGPSIAAVLDAGRGWMAGDPLMSQGPGAAWADFDGDGKVDVAVTAAPEAEETALASRGIRAEDAPPPTVFLGGGDGTFRRWDDTGLAPARGATGLAAADYDADGDADLFVARYGSIGTLSTDPATGAIVLEDGRGLGGMLFRNDLPSGFTEVTAASGLALAGRHTVGGAWGDYDRNGCIDLYTVNMGEILMPPMAPAGGNAAGFADNFIKNESNALWRNNCDGTFTDVTASAGHVTGGGEPGASGALQRLVRVPEEEYFIGNLSGLTAEGSGVSYAALWLDYDEDGDLDLFVADDFGASPLYRNRGDGTFELWTKEAGLLKVGSAMSFTAADFDRDGDLDIFQTNFNRDFLWINAGSGAFVDRAEAWGIPEVAVGWGAQAPDLNLDGFPDLAIATGAMSMNLKASERSVLYLNDGGQRFWDLSAASGFDGPGIAISLTTADADRDGRQDVLVGRINSSNSFYLNREEGGGVVRLTLQGVVSPTFGEGAEVTCLVGGRPFRAAAAPSGEYASSSEPAITIGLGAAAKAERVTVWWPSGTVQVLGDLPAGTSRTVRENATVRAEAGPDLVGSESRGVLLRGSVVGASPPGATYRWSVVGEYDGDGSGGTEFLFHTDTPGEYLATFSVFDRYGGWLGSDLTRVRVLDGMPPLPLLQVLTIDRETRSVRLSAAASADNDPRLAALGRFHWALTDGVGTVEAEGREIVVLLPRAGSWQATLAVTDPSGNRASANVTFSVPGIAVPGPSAAAVIAASLSTAAAAALILILLRRPPKGRGVAASSVPPGRPRLHAPSRASSRGRR